MLAFPPLPSLVPPPPTLALRHSMLLDFDGTLIDIFDRPDAVVIDPALPVLLQRLAETFHGRLALVSGRSVAQLDELLGAALDNLAIVGSHGAEVRTGLLHTSPTRPHALTLAECEIRQAFSGNAGVVIEVKSLGVAVHFRLDPQVERDVRAMINRIALQSGLAVQEGKMMIELRAGGHDKGTGIFALMAVPRFAATVPIFAGDDVTDEAGFMAVAKLNGIGVLVGPERPTAASYRLPDVASVRKWLEQAA